MRAFYHLFTPQIYLRFAHGFYIASNSVFCLPVFCLFFVCCFVSLKRNNIHLGLKLRAGSCSSSVLSPGDCFCAGIAELGLEMEARDPGGAEPQRWENPARADPAAAPAPRAALGRSISPSQVHQERVGEEGPSLQSRNWAEKYIFPSANQPKSAWLQSVQAASEQH